MKRTEFLKIIRKISVDKTIDYRLVGRLSLAERRALVEYLARNRQPVAKALIPDSFNMSWLHAMGYLYTQVAEKSKAQYWCLGGQHAPE